MTAFYKTIYGRILFPFWENWLFYDSSLSTKMKMDSNPRTFLTELHLRYLKNKCKLKDAICICACHRLIIQVFGWFLLFILLSICIVRATEASLLMLVLQKSLSTWFSSHLIIDRLYRFNVICNNFYGKMDHSNLIVYWSYGSVETYSISFIFFQYFLNVFICGLDNWNFTFKVWLSCMLKRKIF